MLYEDAVRSLVGFLSRFWDRLGTIATSASFAASSGPFVFLPPNDWSDWMMGL